MALPTGCSSDGSCAGLSGVINSYWAGESASGTTIVYLANGAAPIHPVADRWVMVHQTQGATITTNDNSGYGDNDPSSPGAGAVTDVSGTYEFARISGTDFATRTLTLSDPLTKTFSSVGPFKFQIVEVVICQEATMVADVRCDPWDGDKGGIIALFVEDDLDMSNDGLICSGSGFRGGQRSGSLGLDVNDYRSGDASRCGFKGEGNAGTPALVFDGTTGSIFGGTTYASGSLCRGAPANAGGGGNRINAGGGGGGNGGSGGKGGETFSPVGARDDFGGFGGLALPDSSDPNFFPLGMCHLTSSHLVAVAATT